LNRRDLLILGSTSIAWPLAAHAQQKATPVIGWLSALSPLTQRPSPGSVVAAFHEGLNQTGYVEGKNVAIEYRWAEGHPDRFPALAADLVARKVDVIVAVAGNGPALAAKRATSTIPIVFTGVGDPVELGLVASLARPGGNLTGFVNSPASLDPKRLELVSELVSQAETIGLLVRPREQDPAGYERYKREMQDAAHAKGAQLRVFVATSENEIDAAFASLVGLHAAALVVASDPFFTQRGEQLVALTAHYAVPAIYYFRGFVAAGGLISYGARVPDLYRGAGAYVGRILAGAKPADLPVQQATKFELVINLKTAKALGLTVPQMLLAQADEVIE